MEQPKKSKIRIDATPNPSFECFGCYAQTKSPFHYGQDLETHWCKDCFVTEEMLEEAKKNMPIWQDILKPKPNPKSKIQIVEKLPTKSKIQIVKMLPVKPKIKIVPVAVHSSSDSV